MKELDVIDSHTGGEPTRLILDGGPALGDGPLSERLTRFAEQHDHWRNDVALAPAGSDVVVGALLCKPHAPDCVAGVIFFNDAGFLGMCGHGAIGVVTSLAHLGRIGPGTHRLDTPVGVVETVLHQDGMVSVRNVPAYRYRHRVIVDVPGHGKVSGDVAWGGNWFFIADIAETAFDVGLLALTRFASAIREALALDGIHDDDDRPIDHIALFGAPSRAGSDSRNFVLCPGQVYDRSPCGTGTSAKLACLAADGLVRAGTRWRQESYLGSTFDVSYTWMDDDLTGPLNKKHRLGDGSPRAPAAVRSRAIWPTITGRARVIDAGERLRHVVTVPAPSAATVATTATTATTVATTSEAALRKSVTPTS